ncbi:DNA polymerase III subunit alpha [Candidatus Saccharibacteria bacterium]|nr:DNA polymerase III subunit alpha [Candidatus Saccharibacteria bacterium]
MEEKVEKKEEIVLKPSDFVHLHNHTHYSLLDGLTKIPELVEFVKEKGMEAVAVTDHGTMSGLVELYKTCKENGIKPVLGLEAYVAARNLEDRDPAHDKQRFHITLLAMNNKGFENLCRIMSNAEINGKYYKPRTDHKDLEKYNEGIICLSGCAGSEISEAIRAGDEKRARELIEWYRNVFKDRFYLEMQDHGHPDSPTHWEDQRKINEWHMAHAEELGLPLVVTCDAHYLKHEDQEAHEVLLCIGTAANLSDTNRFSLRDFQLHVIPPEEIIARWQKTCPEAVLNSKRIAERCNVELELGRILIPKFPVPEGETEKSYLDKLVFRGLVFRYGGKTEEEAKELSVEECRKILEEVDKGRDELHKLLPRIDYELSVVDKMGYNGYFLIVWDFINWGKRKGIIYGPGRGSAAGALLAYAMRITELDPMTYDLLFERFLNPDRISMPDIDTDIQDTRRDEVIQYCTEKYGFGRVSNIATFGKMMAKNAVRDVARVLEVPYAEADRLAKMVPDPVMGHHVHLSDAIRDVPDLNNEYNSNPTAKEVLDFASRLEGTIRGHGVHACGVVIAPDDLVKFVPLEVSAKGPIAAQFPMGTIEELGLLKMDFLGLSNLSVINNALRMVRKVYGEDVNMYSVPLDDPLTYELLQRAETTGVFQLESAGMKRYLKDLKADKFEDIIAMVALYRPGPMQFIESFIKRKHGQEEITYLHPGLENSLKNTYGILIYQEQFMQISREWCGFTGGQADTLRKAVGKKKIDLMNKVKPQFIEGAIKVGGATEEIAEEFWRELLDFANYCFNKSHAACYGLVSYWTAYLKAHYPDAYMAALMTADMRWTDRLAIEIAECKRMGLKVLGPDINQSYGDFGIVKGEKTIRFGLSGIKGVGKALVEEKVIPERDKNGPFKSVCDFAKRVDSTKFNKKAWESTIKTGGFDRFGTRSDLLYNLENIQAYGAKMQKDAASGQTDLFGAFGAAAAIPEVEIKPAPTQHSEKEQLLWERDLMGLYVSAHPLDKYDVYFEEQTHPFSVVNEKNDGRMVVVGGIISGVRTILTKSNTKMAFIKLESKTGEQEVIVFPSTFEEYGGKLVQDNVVKITGRVNAKDKNGNPTSEIKVLAETIEVVTDEILENYQATGTRIEPPKEAPKFRSKTRSNAEQISGGKRTFNRGGANFTARSETPQKATEFEHVRAPIKPPKDPRKTRVFILIKNPDDTETLNEIKRVCDRNLGMNEVVLVLESNGEKRAIKMPFHVEVSEELSEHLKSLVGEEGVKVV